MSVNLVSLVSQFLTPDLISRIAKALGIDNAILTKALGAAVPALLGSLGSVAATPDGARKVFDAVKQHQPSMLESIAGMLGGNQQQGLVDNGTKMLSSLLGGSATSVLGEALGKYAGLGGGASSSLLGLLTPVVMGTLHKQQATSGLDATALANLLTSQKSNIMAALPAGFGELAGVSRLLSGLGADVAGAAAQGAKTAAHSVAASAERTAKEASSGIPAWLWWAVPALAALGLAWWFLGGGNTPVEPTRTVTAPAVQPATAPVPQPPNLMVGSVDIGSSIRTTSANLRQALLGITDAASATAALPKVQEAVTELDKVSALVNQLPAGGKAALALLLASVRPGLDEILDKVLAIPGVAGVAKPAIDGIKRNMDLLAKAAAA